MTEIFFFHKNSWTPLHYASDASTCQLLCALDGVDQNAVNIDNKTALDLAISRSQVDSVHALLEFNVDTSKARVTARTNVEIAQLLEEHRKRSVKNIFFVGTIVFDIIIFRKLNELQFAIECSKNNV